MGLYRDHILPRGINVMMNSKEFRRLRSESAVGLRGTVLEVGFGSGLNLPFYPEGVTKILAVDPATVGRKLARKRLQACPIPVEFVGLQGEELPVESGSVDMVYSTWTLCTISGLAQALSEMKRVLKPGGALRFLEHGLAPDPGVAKWQRRLNGVQKAWAGGCQLVVRHDEVIRAAGFRIDELDNFYMKGPKIGCYMYRGTATTPADRGSSGSESRERE